MTAADHRYHILVLYDPAALSVGTTRDHLLSFSAFTLFRVHHAAAVAGSWGGADLHMFDAVIIHYSCCLYRPGHLDAALLDALARFTGPKVLFLQDEYDMTGHTIAMIRRLGIDVFFTTIAPESVERVYPRAELGREVEFVSTLTGYVPIDLKPADALTPLKERPIVLGYRARKLHYRYGELGHDKFRIGERMRAECLARGIPCDIEWSEDKRIYGDAWPAFVESCRATLGSESGSDVFDYDGSLRAAMDAALAAEPAMSYETARHRFLAGREGAHGTIGAISPRVFEAMALKTALVMFPGRYSGVVRPGRHYIELARDFSNLEEVLARLADLDGLAEMTENAYEDIIASGRFSYAALAGQVAEILRRRLGAPRGACPPAALRPAGAWQHPVTDRPLDSASMERLTQATLPPRPIAVLDDLARLADPAGAYVFGDGRGGMLLAREIERVSGRAARGVIKPGTSLAGLDTGAPVLISNRHVVENAQVLDSHGFSAIYNALPLVRRLAAHGGFT